MNIREENEHPLGIVPRRIHDQKRANEIHQAVNRYLDAGKAVPVVWIEEYNELVNHVYEPTVFESHEDAAQAFVNRVIANNLANSRIVHYTRSLLELDPVCGNDLDDVAYTAEPFAVSCFACKAIISDEEFPKAGA